MKNLYIILSFLFTSITATSYAGGCSPNTSTGTCATSTALTVGAACVTQNTCNGAAPNAAGSGSGQCSWSSFVATSSNMVVNIPVTNTPGCFITSQVYSRTGACSGLTQISSSSGTPMNDAHYLNNLVVGQTYYVEVCEPQFGPCAGDQATYCISVANYTPCNSCSSPCGVAQGFAAAPTAATVVAGCTAADYSPLLQPGHTYTFCNTFTAVATTVSFNVIITSNCGAGNVSAFSWNLFNYPSCGGAIQTGTLASLNLTGLTIGNGYNFCYTFTVPSGCTHTKHCPYYVGATPLPVMLSSFTASQTLSTVNLNWTTETEVNNDYFTIERSRDLVNFEVLDVVKGNGNSNTKINYNLIDNNPLKGTSYYRLKQTDYDGQFEYFEPIAVTIKSKFDEVSVYPNPVTGNGFIAFNSLETTEQLISIYDIAGRVVYEKQYAVKLGENKLVLETTNLTKGMYFIRMADGAEGINIKFIKE